MVKKYSLIALISLFALVLGACQSKPATVEPTVPYPYPDPERLQPGAAPTQDPNAYPSGGLVPGANQTAEWQPVIVPTPGTDTGVVTGYLYILGTDLPMTFHEIYLGIKIYMTPGPSYTLGILENSSPHSTTDGNGRFAISNVPPGSYVLMVWSLYAATSAKHESSGVEVEVVVQPGETVDVGNIVAEPLIK